MMDIASTMIALALTPVTVTGGAFGLSAYNEAVRPLARVKTETGFTRLPLQTEWLIEGASFGGPDDLTDNLRHEATRYSELADGWDGEGSLRPSEASVAGALEFINRLPAGLTLPSIMVNSDGEIGFYWDLSNGYADISFDSEGSGSFYSRPSVGAEVFLENLAMDTFTRAWFFRQLGEMDAPTLRAA